MSRIKQSELHNEILLHLTGTDDTVKSLAELARQIGYHRASVSRSTHKLQNANLVIKNDEGEWLLTEAGLSEVEKIHKMATEKARLASQNIANYSRIASQIVSPAMTEYGRRIANQQSSMAKTILAITSQQRKLLDAAMPTKSLIEYAMQQTKTMEEISARYLDALKGPFPSTMTQDIVLKQFGLYEALRKSGLFDTQNAIASALISTELVSRLVRATELHIRMPDLFSPSSLQNIAAAFTNPSMTEVIARLGEERTMFPRLMQEASSFVIVHQYLNNWALDLPDHSTYIASQLGQTGISISRTISAIAAIKTAQPVYDNLVQISPHITEVTRTQLGLYTDAITRLSDEKHLEMISLPSQVTANYINAAASMVVLSPKNEYVQQVDYLDIDNRISSVLGGISQRFVVLWNGAWEALNSNNPDRLRQSAHSGRELLMQIFAQFAPDCEFTKEEIKISGDKGKITHLMRVEKMFGKKHIKGKWAIAQSDALIKSLQSFTAESHYREDEPPLNQIQLKGLLISMGGLLLFCLTSYTDNEADDAS